MLRTAARLFLLLPVSAALLFTPAAHANTISGVAYCNISSADAANTPAPGVAPSGTECATFSAGDLAFYNSDPNTNTLGAFLNSYSEILGSVTYLNGFSAGSSLDESLFQFTGTGYFVQGQTYNAYHDDGTVMNVGGTTVVNAPSPISLTDTTFVFNNSTGNYDFAYNYTENYGTSAFGTDADASPVPEPSSLFLLATGGAIALLYARRRNLNNSPRLPLN